MKTIVASKVTILPYEAGAFDSITASLSGKVYENTIGNNRFVTFKGDTTLTHLCEYPGRNEIRKVECPLPAYEILPSDIPCGEKKNETALYQIDLDNRRVNCGMTYIFQLADGRFFILDGGYFTFSECDRLYTMLRKLQPEGKLNIVGWFFSHAHQDHFGAFLEFVSKYKNEYTIDTLYYTFPSLDLPESVNWKQSDNATMREFDYTVCKYLPDVKLCFLHSGQSFNMGELHIDVLFTHEDFYPDTIRSFNDTSTVLHITVEGQKILFLGDLHVQSCRKLEPVYGELLKSYIIQVAHHGFNGSTVETYEYASPEVVLWPTADYEFERNTTRDVNAHLLAMTCVKEHIIAGVHGTRKFTFPYEVGTSEEIDLPKI